MRSLLIPASKWTLLFPTSQFAQFLSMCSRHTDLPQVLWISNRFLVLFQWCTPETWSGCFQRKMLSALPQGQGGFCWTFSSRQLATVASALIGRSSNGLRSFASCGAIRLECPIEPQPLVGDMGNSFLLWRRFLRCFPQSYGTELKWVAVWQIEVVCSGCVLQAAFELACRRFEGAQRMLLSQLLKLLHQLR